MAKVLDACKKVKDMGKELNAAGPHLTRKPRIGEVPTKNVPTQSGFSISISESKAEEIEDVLRDRLKRNALGKAKPKLQFDFGSVDDKCSYQAPEILKQALGGVPSAC